MSGATGSCLCGSVKWQINADPLFVCTCHCTRCQKYSGGPAFIAGAVPLGKFEIKDGADKVSQFPAEDGPVMRRFAACCGSPVVTVVDMGEEAQFDEFPVRCLDDEFRDDKKFANQSHMFVSTMCMSINDGLPRWKEYPGGEQQAE